MAKLFLLYRISKLTKTKGKENIRMKTLLLFPIFLSSFLFVNDFSHYMNTFVIENNEIQIPSHAKWGVIAMEKTKEKYPNAKIIDYLHVGKKTGISTSTETFKLWLRHANNEEFGVFVMIEFANGNEQIIHITLTEVSK